MAGLEDPDRELVESATHDQRALDELMGKYRGRLRKMLHVRINPQIRSRVDESDVIQELMIDAARNFAEYADAPRLPFYLWLRHLAGLKLCEIHRRHLTSKKRDASKELSLENISTPDASASSMAAEFVSIARNPSEIAMEKELLQKVEKTLEAMDLIDREILALKHFEQLSLAESAEILGISKAGANGRYLRALKRLKAALGPIG